MNCSADRVNHGSLSFKVLQDIILKLALSTRPFPLISVRLDENPRVGHLGSIELIGGVGVKSYASVFVLH
ncbi:hypothetical protein LENED_010869 [Lentinula edodes]|uniref:Uncharacterized protein n=1 Tax=Lentinula edodes TaxID=5353 RepID=A0A1Q3ENL8_LENED|nr:hypothetical protein LENED_010869 [Lentinula edodes]